MRPLTLLLLSGLAAFAADPAPAAIQKLTDKGAKLDSGAFDTAFVVTESVDGIEFVVDDPRSPNRLTLKYGTYVVTYGDSGSVDYMRGRNFEEAADAAKALEVYKRSAQQAKFQWVKEDSYLRGARAALAAKQPDEVLTLVAALEKEAPRSVLLDDALLLRGQAQAAKGDTAGATKTYATLGGMAKEWGEEAAGFGARGQAGLLAADKKYAEAADLLAKLLARVESKGGEELGALRLELADNLTAAGKTPEALAAYQDLAYRNVGAPLQARAQLAWARILAQKPDAASLADAFDHAAIAGATKGAEPATVAEAKKLAVTVVDKLAKDASVSAADKAEYKKNLGNF